jgi:hypothetical protein
MSANRFAALAYPDEEEEYCPPPPSPVPLVSPLAPATTPTPFPPPSSVAPVTSSSPPSELPVAPVAATTEVPPVELREFSILQNRDKNPFHRTSFNEYAFKEELIEDPSQYRVFVNDFAKRHRKSYRGAVKYGFQEITPEGQNQSQGHNEMTPKTPPYAESDFPTLADRIRVALERDEKKNSEFDERKRNDLEFDGTPTVVLSTSIPSEPMLRFTYFK